MQQAGRGVFVCVLIAAMVASSGIARAATIIVNDASDALHATGCAATGTGSCTLRDAITFSNANPGQDGIGSTNGLGSIALTAPLPVIVDSVVLGGVFNSLGVFHIVGSGASADGLVVAASDSVVDGLAVEGFPGSGIRVTGHRNVLGVQGGAYAPGFGNTVRKNGGHGIAIVGGSSNTVYNTEISSNGGAGILLADGAAGNRIGNHITYVGGYPRIFYNDIFLNGGAGIQIGRDATDVQTTRNEARFNVFGGNGGPHIDLGGDGNTPNDPGDVDAGPNSLQNAPVITVAWDGTQYRLDGTLETTANTPFDAHVHSNSTLYQAFFTGGVTDALGNGSFSLNVLPGYECWTFAVTVTTSAGSSELSAGAKAYSPPSPPPVAPTFHTIEPCRLVDTRGPASPLGGPALASGGARSLALSQTCGVPASAKVLSVNVTVTGSTGAGFLNFGVGKCPAPSTSTINFGAGQTRANSAFLNLASDGAATVTPLVTGQGTVHLVLDVNGYFE